MPRFALTPVVLLALWTIAAPATGQDDAPRRSRTKSRPTTYMGRPIAEVMSFEGADWLVRDTREAEEQPDTMLDALKIVPGSTVADIGAGVGYTSLRLSVRVGPKGTVYATDLQPQMLQRLKSNAQEAGVRNIKAVRATIEDTKLPANTVDLALMVDVYHECPDPEATLRGIRQALKPEGRLALIEYRGEDPEVPIKPEHKMTLAQVRKELEPQGFTFLESVETLPWQHVIVFRKSAEGPRDAATPRP